MSKVITHQDYVNRMAAIRGDLLASIEALLKGAGEVEFDPFIGEVDDEGEVNIRGVGVEDGEVALLAEGIESGDAIPGLVLEAAGTEALGVILGRLEDRG